MPSGNWRLSPAVVARTNADELANMAFHVQTKHLKGAADTGDSTRDEDEASTLKRMADADMLF